MRSNAATIEDEFEMPQQRGWYRTRPIHWGAINDSDEVLVTATVPLQNNSTFGGFLATAETVRRTEEVGKLVALINRFASYGLSWAPGVSARISADTATAAIRLLQSLSPVKRFPKVAPDGDGNLMMIWEGPAPLLVTVEDWKLHVVFAAATPHAQYLEGIPFDGILLPGMIAGAIPQD